MAARKIKVGIIFGGRSAEHEVSLVSARNVYQAIDQTKYELTLIGIDPEGRWHQVDGQKFLSAAADSKMIQNCSVRPVLAALPFESTQKLPDKLVDFATEASPSKLDVVFPVLHGTYGEDGTIQGFLRLAGMPFVGADVLGSAVGMDKDVMKRLLRDAGIPIPKFLSFDESNRAQINFENLSKTLGPILFVKPANAGSSVGVHKVVNADQLSTAVNDAFRFDRKILVEEGVAGKEIEVAVLGNENPRASVAGEIVPASKHGFYSYDAKYNDAAGAVAKIPAEISPSQQSKAQELAIATFKALCCEGLGRVDMFLTPSGEFLVNEINTIPGFTSISMYPKLWEASGLSYRDLISRLLELALERDAAQRKLSTSRA